MELNVIVGVLVGLVSMAVVLITPMIRLNSTITELNVTLSHIQASDDRRDERLDSHANKIDGLEVEVAQHGVEISHLKYVSGLYKDKRKDGKT